MENKISKNWMHEVNKHNVTRDKLKKETMEHNVLKDLYGVMELDRDEWKAKWEKLEREGATLIYVNQEGYITDAIQVNPYFETKAVQVIPEDIKQGYYKLVDGYIQLDKDKKRQIRRGL
jgi:hypothetical protein